MWCKCQGWHLLCWELSLVPFVLLSLHFFRVNVGVKLLGISVEILDFPISPFPVHEVFREVMCIWETFRFVPSPRNKGVVRLKSLWHNCLLGTNRELKVVYNDMLVKPSSISGTDTREWWIVQKFLKCSLFKKLMSFYPQTCYFDFQVLVSVPSWIHTWFLLCFF